jgi:hypothetical protein
MVGDVQEGGDRREPDQLGLEELDAILGCLRPDRLPDPPERRHPEVEQVHRDLGLGRPAVVPLGLLDEEAVRLDLASRRPTRGRAARSAWPARRRPNRG